MAYIMLKHWKTIIINTVHNIHNTTTSHEKLFAGEHNPTIFRLTYTTSLGVNLNLNLLILL